MGASPGAVVAKLPSGCFFRRIKAACDEMKARRSLARVPAHGLKNARDAAGHGHEGNDPDL
jgi:hypothetical protein